MNLMKRLYYTILIIFSCMAILPGQVIAQADSSATKSSISVGSDLMSRYIWRGTQFSTGPSIQPTFEFGYGNFAIGTWGAYSFNGADGAEADIYLSYTFAKDMFTIAVTDYFFPNEVGGINNYFEYNKNKTGHIFEPSLSFNGTESFPLTLYVAANVYGADAKRLNDDPNSADFNTETGNMYSIYAELGYSLQVNEVGLDIFAGFTPTQPKAADSSTGFIGESGFYGDYWGFVNIGATASREIQITDKYAIPVSASLIANPMAENIFIVFGFSF